MAATNPEPAHRIVVGIDGSACSRAALEWAAHQAELTGATLEAVISWEWPTAYGVAFSYLPPDYDPGADARTVLDQALESIRGAHPRLTIRPVIREGHPAPALVDASQGAELLVVGSRGHREVHRNASRIGE